jgi:hypothetical protein
VQREPEGLLERSIRFVVLPDLPFLFILQMLTTDGALRLAIQ